MAEAIISAIIGDVVSRVISLLIGHFSDRHEQSTEAKLRRICHMIIRIHSAVEEAKGRQIENDGTLEWLSELIDSEYQGRYMLDTIVCGEHELEDEQGDKVPPKVSTVSLFNPAKRMCVAACTMRSILSQHRDVDEIDRVIPRLEGMSDELKEFIMLLQSCQQIRRPLVTNIFRDGLMFGRHVEKERIINFLLQDCESSIGQLSVLPIVGNIGVGKTTVMQHACNDARVRNHFPLIMLSNFSCTYAVTSNEGSPNSPLQFVKRNNFRDKRFLMVFEDVDMHKKQKVEELLTSLKCGKEGSKVIITTNDRRVATIGTVEPIILKVLPRSEYWFFFKAYAFAGRDIEDNPRLVVAGKAIAKKLNGSFFGAKIVGEVLRDNPDPKFWCKVMRSNIGGLSLLGDGIAYISELAENLLPGHVDTCKVIISKDQFPSQTTGLALLQDLCSAAPHGGEITCLADNVRFEKVLLCKSVFPFYNCYHIARYTCTCAKGSASCYPKLTVV